MINGVSIKVCGITSLEDAETALSCGADYLGFIQYPKSPRYLPLEGVRQIKARIPGVKTVGVYVYSSMNELEAMRDAGFDYVQLHFPNETPFFEAALWTEILPPSMLWMAPRIPPGKEIDLAFLPLADFFILDSYHPTHMGGSGQVGDWYQFYRLKGMYQKINWVLAGGLNPDNISAALKETQALFVDVNSGVELSPGKKDPAKLKAFFDAIKIAA